jgi:hypothetical protein
MVLGTLATLGLRLLASELRWGGRPAWLAALGATLVVLAARLVVMARAARRGELPWPRLILPGIFWLEGAGVWWGDGAPGWQLVRLVTALCLEVAFVGFAIRQLWRAPSAGDAGELPEARLARPLSQLVPPRVARLIAFELVIIGSALRFVLGGWRRPTGAGFSYHRDSALRLLLQMLPLIAVADVALLELVILPHAALWLKVALHAAAIYGLIWLIGVYASVRARPHRVDGGRATLHRGPLGHVVLPLEQIASIGALPAFRDDWKRRAYMKRSICVGVPGATIVELGLRGPIQATGVLGPGRTSDRVLVAVDDPAGFIAALGEPRAQPAA